MKDEEGKKITEKEEGIKKRKKEGEETNGE
jgi:hypothetical protein